MRRISIPITFSTVAFLFAAAGIARAQQELIFSNVAGTDSSSAWDVGVQPGLGQSNVVGFDFTVAQGPDVQLENGELLAGLDSTSPATGLTLNLYSTKPVSQASTPIDTMSVGGLGSNASLMQFTSTANPILSAGQQYWLTATVTNPSATALWWQPTVANPGELIISANGKNFSAPNAFPRGAFALAGTPVDWQTHFSGSATIGGTGMQNAVMVFESFDANSNVLDKFVQPLGNFNPNTPTSFNFAQSLKVNGVAAIYTILGTYGSASGNHGVIVGTTQSIGNTATSNSSSFGDVYNGANEESLYDDLTSGDNSDVQNFFDNQPVADGGSLGGGGGLPDFVLNGQDYQDMLADGGVLGGGSLPDIAMAGLTAADETSSGTLGGSVDAPDMDFISFSDAAQIGTGSLALTTVPEPSSALMFVLLAPMFLSRRHSPACTCGAPSHG